MSIATRMLLAAAILSLGSLSWAATLSVGQPNTNCPGAIYGTITAAVNAASPGDTIEICPATYAEQVLITKPLSLIGVNANGVGRVLVQPSTMSPVGGLSSEAVITVMNTYGVTIKNLAVDASKNGTSGCAVPVAVIHYYNASGDVESNALSGALVSDPTNCATLLPLGSGFGVQVDSSGSGSFRVNVANNSIHDYTRNGVLARGAGIVVTVNGNTISGIGPSVGVYQFGVFLENGPVGVIANNTITEGLCGALSLTDCKSARSEGVTLRSPGNGTVVENNVITNAQSGIFINGGSQMIIRNNTIRNIQGYDGIDIQGTASGSFTQSLIQGNTIFNVTPIGDYGCGIWEDSGTGVAGNLIDGTTVNDAYCGVAYVEADHVLPGDYNNALYLLLDTDANPTNPPPTEP
jgi:parallel beta-helix repeat protein